jgi:hypothetical protein
VVKSENALLSSQRKVAEEHRTEEGTAPKKSELVTCGFRHSFLGRAGGAFSKIK